MSRTFSSDLPGDREHRADPAAIDAERAEDVFRLAEAAGYDLRVHTRRVPGVYRQRTSIEAGADDDRRTLHLYLHNLPEISEQQQALEVLDAMIEAAAHRLGAALDEIERAAAGLAGPAARAAAAGLRLSETATQRAAVMLNVLTHGVGGVPIPFEARADLALRWAVQSERDTEELNVDLTVTRVYTIGVPYGRLDAHPDTQGWERWASGEAEATETMLAAVADLAASQLGDFPGDAWQTDLTVERYDHCEQ